MIPFRSVFVVRFLQLIEIKWEKTWTIEKSKRWIAGEIVANRQVDRDCVCVYGDVWLFDDTLKFNRGQVTLIEVYTYRVYHKSNNRAINVCYVDRYSNMAKQNDNESTSHNRIIKWREKTFNIIIIMIQWFRLSIIHFGVYNSCVFVFLLLLFINMIAVCSQCIVWHFSQFSIYSSNVSTV